MTVDGRLDPWTVMDSHNVLAMVLDVGVGFSGSSLGGDGGIMNDGVVQSNTQRRMKL